MGYWYIKAKITQPQETTSKKRGIFGGKKTITKNISRLIEGKVIGIGNTGFYGSWPCYMVATKEGLNPKIEAIYMDVDGGSGESEDNIHEVIELTYRGK